MIDRLHVEALNFPHLFMRGRLSFQKIQSSLSSNKKKIRLFFLFAIKWQNHLAVYSLKPLKVSPFTNSFNLFPLWASLCLIEFDTPKCSAETLSRYKTNKDNYSCRVESTSEWTHWTRQYVLKTFFKHKQNCYRMQTIRKKYIIILCNSHLPHYNLVQRLRMQYWVWFK